jgi:hypothetical protein
MSEHKMPESDATGRPAGKAGDRASSPSRRRAFKAALATAPVLMSLKSRPAFAAPKGPNANAQQTSSALSNNLSAQLKKNQ